MTGASFGKMIFHRCIMQYRFNRFNIHLKFKIAVKKQSLIYQEQINTRVNENLILKGCTVFYGLGDALAGENIVTTKQYFYCLYTCH